MALVSEDIENYEIFEYIWPVDPASLRGLKVKERVQSPVFSTVHNSISYNWYLGLYPKGHREQNSNHFMLLLFFKNGPHSKIKVLAKKHLFIWEPSATSKAASVPDFQQEKETEFETSFGFPFAASNFLENYIQPLGLNRTLVQVGVQLCIRRHFFDKQYLFVPRNITSESDRSKQNADETLSKDSNDLRALLFEQVSKPDESAVTDFILKSRDGVAFPVHKTVLHTRCPELSRMLKNDLSREVIQGEMVVKNLDQHALWAFLRFMYLGTVPENFGNIALQLLDAAEMYRVQGELKDLCEKELIKFLAPDNVYKYLQTSALYRLGSLKDACEKELVHSLNKQNASTYIFTAKEYSLEVLMSLCISLVFENWAEVQKSADGKKILKDIDLIGKILTQNSQRCGVTRLYYMYEARGAVGSGPKLQKGKALEFHSAAGSSVYDY